MIEREKVQHGLECCYNDNCGACPYSAIKKCQHKLHSDALSLLKEQEPRVMTPEEASNALQTEDFVIIEDTENGVLFGMRGEEDIQLSNGEYIEFYDLEVKDSVYRRQYGRTFRLWTHKPSEDQRKGVKWDD